MTSNLQILAATHISSMKFPSLFGKKFKCQACGQSFKDEEELHEHERQTHLQGKKG